MLLICLFSNFFPLNCIQFYYPNASVLCMMNRFYLLLIISFWNKYKSRNGSKKQSLWHLVTFFTQSVYCFCSPSKFFTFFLCGDCFLFGFLHHAGLPGVIVAFIFYHLCFSFYMPQASQCCWFVPFQCIVIAATSVSAFLEAAHVSSLASRPQLYFFHQAKCSCVGIV